jgi:protein-L-isoaspartate O-methyltransferase
MNISFLNALRTAEMRRVMDWYRPLFAGKRVLEIGSGTGAQLNVLGELASEITGVDLADGT